MSDLLGCIGGERTRFEACLQRLSRMSYPALVVEASLSEMLRETQHNALHPNAVLGSLVAWSTRWRIPIWFCDNRRLALIITERLLTKAAKYSAEDS